MEIHELQQLLSEMSLQEKIGQMVQLTGVYFDKEAVLDFAKMITSEKTIGYKTLTGFTAAGEE